MEVFTINSFEINDRLDPLFLRYNLSANSVANYPVFKLKEFLVRSPQYGANERAIDYEEGDIRYIRITDIDKYGNLKSDGIKSAENTDLKYLLNPNDILLARSGATAGKAFIFNSNMQKSIFAGYLIRFVFRKDRVRPKYIFYYTLLSRYNEWVESIQRLSGQPNINSEEFKNLEIPLPPIEKQDLIVSLMDKAFSIKHNKENESEKLLNDIDNHIINKLGIKLPDSNYAKIFKVNSEDLKDSRIDPYYFCPEFVVYKFLKSNYHCLPLSEVVSFSNETWDQKSFFEKTFPYIEISDINIKTGKIENLNYIEKKKAPSRAKMIVRTDDIIVSTTRPHRGSISLLSEEYNKNIASTGFVILRDLLTNKVSRKYLFSILRSKLCLNQMLQRSSGGNYPAITGAEMKNILIPIPDHEIQESIVNDVFSRIEKVELMKKEADDTIEIVKRQVEMILFG